MSAFENVNKDNLKLEVKTSIIENKLHLSYTLSNVDNKNTYLIFNQIPDEDENIELNSLETNTSNVYIDFYSGICEISKKIFPVSKDQFVENLIIPYATELKPHTEIKETCIIQLPLVKNTPYFEEKGDKNLTRKNIPIRFTIGYIKLSNIAEKLINKVKNKNKEAFYIYPINSSAQSVIYIDFYSEKITVLM